MKNKTQVYLVGAGPGDTGLITVKGLRCLQQADVVLYDKLANPQFLKEAPDGAELIYVGKVKGHHLLPQEQINELLEEKACPGRIVVRLKGGDPYIFGRGGEEAQHLEQAGIPFEVVPGITAGFAAAAYAGIPVTHRDCTTSVSLITGHSKSSKEGQSDINWKALASGNGTLVFYMGLSNITTICQELISNGRDATTPVAIISCATTEQQQTITTTLGEAPQQTEQNKVPPPAVIVVGEVVSLRNQLRWFDSKTPMEQHDVLPHTQDYDSELSKHVSQPGAESIHSRVVEKTAPTSLPVLLKNPQILILGGGKVAYRKARILSKNQVKFKILSQSVLPEFKALEGDFELNIKQIHADDLQPFNIIIDATGNPEVAKLVRAQKLERFILVNFVNDPAGSDFYFSALLNYGSLKIAVSTDGASPTIGKVVRDRIKDLIPADISELVKAKALDRHSGVIEPEVTKEQVLASLARVYLIGCDSEKDSVLNLQAYRCVQKTDIVLYDQCVSQQIIDSLPGRVRRICVSEQEGSSGLNQDEINQLALECVQKGLRITRLKSGSPAIWGGKNKEVEFLLQHGVELRVISG